MMMALIVFVAAGVLVRFLPFASMGWADEIIELAFAWLVFLGAASLWRDRTHFRVDLLPTKLGNSKAGLRLEIGLALLALGFFLVFTYQGGGFPIKRRIDLPFWSFPDISGTWSCRFPGRSSLGISFGIFGSSLEKRTKSWTIRRKNYESFLAFSTDPADPRPKKMD